MTKAEYLLSELRSSLWVKPSIMGVAASAWVSIAYLCSTWMPGELWIEVKRDILINLLGIMASTMLTVATFSVAAMVSAFASVASTATPRATRIVMQDSTSQNALTSFLSAFIYAIVALVAISIANYGQGGRALLFVGYAFMVGWVLVSFVRWVDRVSKLGRMGDTLERVEEACREAFCSPEAMGTLGAAKAEGDAPSGTRIKASKIGYVQSINVAELDRIAEKIGGNIHILERPGAFVDPHDSLVVISGGEMPDEETSSLIHDCFNIGDARRVVSDPRFGMIILSEIAGRALSPAVNDPGTAIAVLGIQIRLVETWSKLRSETDEVKYPNVEVAALDPEDLLDDAFTAISRDGAAIFEVGVRVQKCLAVLARLGHGELTAAARRHSSLALEQSDQALKTESHREAVRQLAGLVGR
ncbi:DUF2254 domain-containing protein [Akkermansiaceae bacterium]|nr:DUF2254 domain-containing protein [Akkermansiaceae bacterium]